MFGTYSLLILCIWEVSIHAGDFVGYPTCVAYSINEFYKFIMMCFLFNTSNLQFFIIIFLYASF